MAKDETSFRRATVDDCEAIAGVIAIVMKDRQPVGFERAYTSEEMRTWFSRLGDDGAVFLCIIDEQVAGFAAVDFNTQEPDTATVGVWLLREHRGKGLGTELARLALDFARDRGYRRIRGRLPAGNEVALSFLSSIGALVPIYNPNMRFELPL
jgi:RimJ/RimL family protein N-acetyltransferase